MTRLGHQARTIAPGGRPRINHIPAGQTPLARCPITTAGTRAPQATSAVTLCDQVACDPRRAVPNRPQIIQPLDVQIARAVTRGTAALRSRSCSGAASVGENHREPVRGRPVSRRGGRRSRRWSLPGRRPGTGFSGRVRSSDSSSRTSALPATPASPDPGFPRARISPFPACSGGPAPGRPLAWSEHGLNVADLVELFACLSAVGLLLAQAGKLHGMSDDEQRMPVTSWLPAAAGPGSRPVLCKSRTRDR
jgi:hypothetical protein